MWLLCWRRYLLPTTIYAFLLATLAAPANAQNQTGQGKIVIDYNAPTNPAHQPVYQLMKERRALESVQELFSPYRLPRDLTILTKTCGMNNAWYHRPAVTLCYEYIDDFLTSLPKETTPMGVTQSDAVLGQFLYVAGHEMGHAMFDYLNVPLFGNTESAADHFSAYLMLSFGKEDARKLILGAAYAYQNYMKGTTVKAPLQAFSDVHGAPMQRYYNLLCMGLGADAQTFSDVVEKGYLPRERARNCGLEFDEVNYAFSQTVAPFIDKSEAAKSNAAIQKVLNQRWVPVSTARPPAPAVPAASTGRAQE